MLTFGFIIYTPHRLISFESFVVLVVFLHLDIPDLLLTHEHPKLTDFFFIFFFFSYSTICFSPVRSSEQPGTNL